MLDVTAVRAYIDKRRGRRQSNKVLHGHPSPVFWLERDVSIPDVMTQRESAAAVRKRINLYVGTPYCLPTEPDRCGFCLFPSEVYRDRRQLDRYLDYLRREGDLFRPYLGGSELASIYFGGGTSNLYRADQYAVLMDVVRGVFDVPAGIEVTLEGIPQTFSHEKLAAMKACGINPHQHGRAATRRRDDPPERAAPDGGAGLSHHRVLPGARPAAQPRPDLRVAEPDHGPDAARSGGGRRRGRHAHHPLRAERRRAHGLLAPTAATSCRRPSRTWRCTGRGATSCSRGASRRRRPTTSSIRGRCRAPTCTRSSSAGRSRTPAGNSWGTMPGGWGFAGVSFFFGSPQSPGWAYLNQVRVDDYFRDLDAGRFPVLARLPLLGNRPPAASAVPGAAGPVRRPAALRVALRP